MVSDWAWLDFDTPPLCLDKGKHLFNQGEAIERMYFIAGGRVKLLRHTHEGGTVILQAGTTGEMIAEASLFSETYHCSAIIEQSAKIYTLRRDFVLSRILDNPANSHQVLKLFSHQIRDLRGLIEVRNIRSAQARTLTYLRSVAEANGQIVLHTPLRDIANQLGLAHETLYRELRQLEEKGMIDRSSAGIIKLQQ